MLAKDTSTKKLIYVPNRWVPYHSPLLGDIANTLSQVACPIVLDLGSASTESIEYYSSFGAKVFIEDLRNEILVAGSNKDELACAVERISQRGPQKACEVVMLWDLLNYLPCAQRKHLATYVNDVTPIGSFLYLSIWTLPLMPDMPLRFDPLPHEQILYRMESAPNRPAPLMTKPDIAKLFPEFQRVRSFLSRTGLEEQLLVKRPSP